MQRKLLLLARRTMAGKGFAVSARGEPNPSRLRGDGLAALTGLAEAPADGRAPGRGRMLYECECPCRDMMRLAAAEAAAAAPGCIDRVVHTLSGAMAS